MNHLGETNKMSDMVNVVICDGKYAIIQDESGNTNVLRYGEGWRNVTGDNVILGAAYEIDKLREHIKRLEEAGDAMEKYIHDQTNTRFIICAIRWREAKEAKL